jgi:antitoxin HicB
MKYTVVLLRESVGGYSVHVPALKGCATQGHTLPDALDMAREAIVAYSDGERELGKQTPPDVQQFRVDLGDANEGLIMRVSVPDEDASPRP